MTRGKDGEGIPGTPHRLPRARAAARAAGVSGILLLVCAAPACAAASGSPSETTTAPTTTAPPTATDDLYTVYCLDPEHRARTVAAAVRLGVAHAAAGHADMLAAGPGRTGTALPLTRWAAAHPAAFRRVCSAVVAVAEVAPDQVASQGGDSDGIARTTILTTVGAVIGAAITLLGGSVERAATRGREWSRTLHAAGTTYDQRARAFLDDWETGADTPFDDVKAARTELATLLRTPLRHGVRRDAFRLVERLPLPETPPSTVEEGTWVREMDLEDRQGAAARERAALDRTITDVGALVGTGPRWYLTRTSRRVAALVSGATRHRGGTP